MKHVTYLLFLLSLCLFSSHLIAIEVKLSCHQSKINFAVELAQTPEEREKGLMYREHLAPNEGMLFCFSTPQSIAMWMKNTPLSLDMIFINQKGEIVFIAEKTVPQSLKLIGPVENTVQVLELLGGTVGKHKISKACTVDIIQPKEK